jgi:CheY-like chemotaxis protein
MNRILVLEFHPELAVLLRSFLNVQGYDALVTSSAREALDLVRSHRIDLLILGHGDVEKCQAPNCNSNSCFPESESSVVPRTSQEFLCAVKNDQTLRHIPAVIFTGYPRCQSDQFLLEHGLDPSRDVDAYVGKGIGGIEPLLDAVETILVNRGKTVPQRCNVLPRSTGDPGAAPESSCLDW